MIKVLNLYSGIGGNRKMWKDVDVVAVESDEKIAGVYLAQFPQDKMVIGDAHQYLIENHAEFDFIWSSPPCQSHSKMNLWSRHKTRRFPDMKLYEEILFLKHFCKDIKWCVENVVPYYEPLVQGQKLGRHLVWTNFPVTDFDVPRPTNFIKQGSNAGKKILMDWLGIHYKENICYQTNHDPCQILRNCVHPKVGLHIFDSANGENLPNTTN